MKTLSASPETPPLARGRRIIRESARSFLGNTPACAGKTSGESPQETPAQKHPRLRGEDYMEAQSLRPTLETPPLARGRPTTKESGSCARRKHPRLRGEDTHLRRDHRHDEETPPLARGRREGFRDTNRRFGNTPACAGKTVFRSL